MQEIISQFIDALCAAGCAPEDAKEIVADDQWNSYRIVGQRNKSKKYGYYQLKVDGDFGVGRFGDRREGVTHPWHSNSNKKFSQEEKAEWKKRIDSERARKDKELLEQYAQASERAKKIFDNCSVDGSHQYLSRKSAFLHGARISEGDLVIPMYSSDGELCGLQTISPDGDKLYMRGAKKSGCYFPITGPEDNRGTIIVCEGFATGSSIRQAMGNVPVIVAFDASNLSPVATVLREKYPTAKILIAADNDRFTERSDGEKYNTGVIKGFEAAEKIAGICIAPLFPEDDYKGSDYNDLHTTYGLDSVRDRLSAAITADQEAPVSIHDSPSDDVPADGGDSDVDDVDESGYDDGDEDEDEDGYGHKRVVVENGDFGLPFRVLGYDGDKVFYYPFGGKQIITLSSSAHTMQNLLSLAPLEDLENEFGGKDINYSRLTLYALDKLKKVAISRGVFVEEDRIRGCGVWIDAKRTVLHCGDVLYVDNVETEAKDIIGYYTYIAASRLLRPAKESLSDEQCQSFLKICESVTWEDKMSGTLLAGWLVLAPVCAALTWRPHIWITGEAESGKTTVIEKIVTPALGQMALRLDGGTTEAAIRYAMGYNGRPVIYDEAEAGANPKIMEGVIELARGASMGKPVGKYGQNRFRAQFMVCFSAINPPVDKTADESRIIFLNIKKNRRQNAHQDYANLLQQIDETFTPNFSNRLLARTLDNLPAVLKNIETFKRVVRKEIKGARAADQIGTVMAGVYLLHKTGLISDDEAAEFIKGRDWTIHTNIAEAPDPIRLIQYISTALIRFTPTIGNSRDVPIGELVLIAGGVEHSDYVNSEAAKRLLGQYSINVRRDGVAIGNSNQNLKRILKDTDWRTRWSRTLSDIPGAKKLKQAYFAAADKQDAVLVPLSVFNVGEEEMAI